MQCSRRRACRGARFWAGTNAGGLRTRVPGSSHCLHAARARRNAAPLAETAALCQRLFVVEAIGAYMTQSWHRPDGNPVVQRPLLRCLCAILWREAEAAEEPASICARLNAGVDGSADNV